MNIKKSRSRAVGRLIAAGMALTVSSYASAELVYGGSSLIDEAQAARIGGHASKLSGKDWTLALTKEDAVTGAIDYANTHFSGQNVVYSAGHYMHSVLNGMGATVTLIEVTGIGADYNSDPVPLADPMVIMFYNDLDWGGVSYQDPAMDLVETGGHVYITSDNTVPVQSFIGNVTKDFYSAPRVLGEWSHATAYNHVYYDSYGPTAGGGADLSLKDTHWERGYANEYSYSLFEQPSVLGDTGGQRFFSVGQVEIFTLEDSQDVSGSYQFVQSQDVSAPLIGGLGVLLLGAASWRRKK